jgi:hypothetical protein
MIFGGPSPGQVHARGPVTCQVPGVGPVGNEQVTWLPVR